MGRPMCKSQVSVETPSTTSMPNFVILVLEFFSSNFTLLQLVLFTSPE